MSDQTSYDIGDGDLLFLGMAAVLAARFQARRKGARITLATYPQSDPDAIDLLRIGMDDGTRFPLDDVPEVKITVHMDSKLLHRILTDLCPFDPD